MSEDLYKALNLNEDASKVEITEAFRKLAKEYHPDKVAHLGSDLQQVAEEKMRLINRAYSTLSDTLKRKEYDQSRRGVAREKIATAEKSTPKQRSATAYSGPENIDGRDKMMIETQLYEIKEKIRTETKLDWVDFKEPGFTSAIEISRAGLGKKNYVVFFHLDLQLEPKSFLEFTHKTRSRDSASPPGFLTSRQTIYIIAFASMDSPAKIEEIFNQYNNESTKGGKTARHLVLLNVSNYHMTFPKATPKDKFVQSILEALKKKG